MKPSPVPLLVLVAAARLAGLGTAPLPAQQEVGADDFRISFMGGSGDIAFRATYPAVAYNATDDEYFVVWEGDTAGEDLVDDQYQIFGQRIDAATGAALGSELQLSAIPHVFGFIPPYRPAVAWNSNANQYLVVWAGVTGECCEIDYELFARRISAAGAALGAAVQISHMAGPPANPNEAHFDAYDPAVAFNPTADEYLVVWSGDDGRSGRLNEEFEIHGQRISAVTGGEVGSDDLRISDAGGTGNIVSQAYRPSVAFNVVDGEYLVVWWGEDLDAGTVDGEHEIFGQRLDGASAIELGANDFRISATGPAGETAWFAADPVVAHNPVEDEYLVVWAATETVVNASTYGLEIVAQRLDNAGVEIGADDQRLTDVGGLGEAAFKADLPKVVYSPGSGRYLVAFRADDNLGGQVFGEREIHLQAVDGETGSEVGPNDLRISDMGTNGAASFATIYPALATANDGGALVAWQAEDDGGGMVDNEYEIFGQRLSAGPLFADGFESGLTTAWSVAVP
jgi:large repetitive protein